MKQVSVIIPTYNRKELLARAMESVLRQSYPVTELIIVDDGSTDGTGEMIASMEDPRIHYVYTKMNRGAAAARNVGMTHVSSDMDFVAFQDSDDLWLPGKLEKQMKALEIHPEAGFCYHKFGYRMSDGHLEILPSESVPMEKKTGDIYGQLLYENMVGTPTLIVKKDALDQTGGFDESLKAWEDYDLILRLAKNEKAIFVDEVLVEATLSSGGVSDSAGNYMMACCTVLRKYRDDLLATGMFNHRLETILNDAERLGMKDQIVALLEKLLQT